MSQGNGNGSDATLASFIWKNAEALWGDFKHTDFGKIILPFTLLRRLECVLEPTREIVRTACSDPELSRNTVLPQITGYPFYNTSQYSLATLGGTKTRENLQDYVAHFSENARIIFAQFDFSNTILRMEKQGVLFKICNNFAEVDLHPDAVSDRVMSNVYEHLIRRFGAEVNEGAEDFMTPRDVVHLATTIVLDPDDALFEARPGLIRTLYDPACGTGGFLSDAMAHVASYADASKIPPVLIPYGQELEPETHAVCLTGMLLRRVESDPSRDLSQNIKLGSTLSDDHYSEMKFHYGLANPPFGKKWEKDQKAVTDEFTTKGFSGRFGPGLPRVSDGSMLFLQHLVSKMETLENGGGRAAIVLSGSPLFNGNAGSGESNIRRWLLEKDYVEAIIAMPTEIFFRTGIGTYLWILTNRKAKERKGKVQLINAVEFFTPMRKSEGNKRKAISDEQIAQIASIYAAAEDSDVSLMLDHRAFGYRRIRVLRPLKVKLHITEEGLNTLQNEKVWQKLSALEQEAWSRAVATVMGQERPYAWGDTFIAETAKKEKILSKVSKPFAKAFVKVFSVSDPEGEIVLDDKGNPLPDTDLTDYENVPLLYDGSLGDYFAREVLPHVPDAWLDESYCDDWDGELGKAGYEINFNRFFYKYVPPRPLQEINTELKELETEIAALLREVADD